MVELRRPAITGAGTRASGDGSRCLAGDDCLLGERDRDLDCECADERDCARGDLLSVVVDVAQGSGSPMTI